MQEKTHDGRHGPDCFGCRIQGVNFDPRAMPSRRNSNEPTAMKANPAWEAGIAGEHRRDGTFMPYIRDHSMNAIHVKEFAERQHELEPAIRDIHRHRGTVT